MVEEPSILLQNYNFFLKMKKRLFTEHTHGTIFLAVFRVKTFFVFLQPHF